MKKILIIEDNTILSDTLSDNLTHEGFEVLLAKDGDEGLSSAFRNMPDLILLDILLPKLDGLQVLDKLRVHPWGKSVPVIILSNLSEPQNVATALEKDIHEYLVKTDWKMEDVVKRIKARLKM